MDSGGNCSATPKTGCRCTTLTYDIANQLKTITYCDGVTPNVTNVSYDGDGQWHDRFLILMAVALTAHWIRLDQIPL